MGKATKSIYVRFTRRLKNENREFLYKIYLGQKSR